MATEAEIRDGLYCNQPVGAGISYNELGNWSPIVAQVVNDTPNDSSQDVDPMKRYCDGSYDF